ncbi:MAG TPA: TIGR03960 family B12-binding radical SAM protein [Smithellaceae bacterium]|nr:TIGR03960 family B12-binding radical SAM protein [Smithellaceae bacterium]HRS89906.1 TIGR03960 family B12-binding radical SAM protein [Smithellaceae bacterium]HRV26695.1 TIGR03960 family B12-binding radical SAM protein [Smithellaceae bacterium]
MTFSPFDDLLPAAEKPSRYLGIEVNAARRGKQPLNFLLAFPDAYEVGMSHLGLQILYSILNKLPDVQAERCFAPWPDREKQLREKNLPLTSLETQTPLYGFDIIGFSLQYELSYTNVLNMLELGQVPYLRDKRGDSHPLIIAGGPCCFNPAPLVDFIDAFVIGEGEEIVSEIATALLREKQASASRLSLLTRLADIPGIYVPAIHKNNQIIKKRTVADLNQWKHPEKPVVPLMQTIHDRIVLEIARGCTRGCRFCQAGMIWRPYRERDLSLLLEMAERTLWATGYDEISLLSLSSGDYTVLESLIRQLMRRHCTERVALALPSLRVESLTETMIDEIKRIRKTSFTLAPEAGTDKMRRIINKGNNANDLLAAVDKIFSAGWKSIKLYFMIGLPGETQDDLEGIVDLCHAAMRAARNRGEITISLSTFVPKPHTPFQWEKQISPEETFAKQNFIREHLKSRRFNVKWHDARMSFLEGILSRGDEKLGATLKKAFSLGCRFDGWSEIFRFDLWQQALQETGNDASECLAARDTDTPLPWDNIDCGISREFLLAERQKAHDTLITPDCRLDTCQLCGACDFTITKNIFSAAPDPELKSAKDIKDADKPLRHEKIYRISFRKFGLSRFLSHLEISAAFVRALRRSGLPLSYSTGFHPHPKISFATATAVGMESREEFVDITAGNYTDDLTSLVKIINLALPAGIEITVINTLAPGAKSLAQSLYGFIYEIHLPKHIDDNRLNNVKTKIDQFMNSVSFIIPKQTRGKSAAKDIRPFVESIALDETEKIIESRIIFSQTGTARPSDIIIHALGLSDEETRQTRVVKTKTVLI